MRSLLVGFTLIVVAITAPMMAAQKVELSIDTSKTGAKIDRNIFGQFAEHLGHGIYEGIWVGPDSRIPNTRGIRNDVVEALKRSTCRTFVGPVAASPMNITGARASALNDQSLSTPTGAE